MQTQIVILAGGLGKRMGSDIPKAMTLLNGVPFIRHLLDTVAQSDICPDPIIVVGKQKEMIMDYLGPSYKYAIQEEQKGTAHALSCAESLCGEYDSVLVLYADHPLVSKETIQKIANTQKEQNATIAFGTVIVPHFEDWYNTFYSFGRFIKDDNGNIQKIVELKDANEEEKFIKEVNPGYMCFNRVWLWENIKNLNNNNAQGEYYLTDLVGLAFEQKCKLATVEIEPKEALGVNTKEQLEIIEGLL